MTLEPQPAPEPVKITTELLDYLDGLYAGTVEATGPVLIPVQELVAAARLGTAFAEANEAKEGQHVTCLTEARGGHWAAMVNGPGTAFGPDPVAALRALTEKLRTP